MASKVTAFPLDIAQVVEACTAPAFLWKPEARHLVTNPELQRRRGADTLESKPLAKQVLAQDSISLLMSIVNGPVSQGTELLNVLAQNGLVIPMAFRLSGSPPRGEGSTESGYIVGFAIPEQTAEVQTARTQLKPVPDANASSTGNKRPDQVSNTSKINTQSFGREKDTTTVDRGGAETGSGHHPTVALLLREPSNPESPTALVSGLLPSAIADDATFRAIVDRMLHGLLLLDQSASIVWTNKAAEAITGYDANSLIGRSLYSLLIDADAVAVRQDFRGEVQRGGVATKQATLVNPTLGQRHVDLDFFPAQRHAGLFACALRDVTGETRLSKSVYTLAEAPPRCKASELLAMTARAMNVRFAALVRRDPIERDSFIITDICEKGAPALHPSVEDAAIVDRIVQDFIRRRGSTIRTQYLTISQDESSECVLTVPLVGPNSVLSGLLVCLSATTPDSIQSTERLLLLFAQRISAEIEAEELESRLLQGRESETLRHLARGIAHEFNNVLMRISGNFQLLERKIDATGPLRKYVDSGLAAVKHGATVVKEVEEFSTNQAIELEPLLVSTLLHRAKKLWDKTIPSHVTLSVSCPESVTILGNKPALLEVLGQLIRNALDAIDQAAKSNPDLANARGGHRISISMSLQPTVNGAKLCKISVTDTGVGMNDQMAAQVFDPFYTTKEPGRGTGLGLSIAQAIVAKHQGRIEVSGAIGRGSRFDIFIPTIEGGAVLPIHDTMGD